MERLYDNIFNTSASVNKKGVFFDVNSLLVPAYIFNTGLIADIENVETEKVTTVVEYSKITTTRGSLTLVRSYKAFVDRTLMGGACALTIQRGGVSYRYEWSKSVLTVNDITLMAVGCPSNDRKVTVELHGTESTDFTRERVSEFVLYVDNKLFTDEAYTSMLKQFKQDFFPRYLESSPLGYTVVEDLDTKMFTPVEILPKFKRPAERIAYIDDLVNLLVDVEEVEVKEVEMVDTKVVVTVEPPKEEEWVPEGWEE